MLPYKIIPLGIITNSLIQHNWGHKSVHILKIVVKAENDNPYI